MRLDQFFHAHTDKKDFVPNKITRGTWLTNGNYLVCIIYIDGNFQPVAWDDGEQAHHFSSPIPVATVAHVVTQAELELSAKCFWSKDNLKNWRIISNKEAAELIAKMPSTSV